MIDFGFASYWLRNMPKISEQFTKCGTGNRVILITLDSHLKTALICLFDSSIFFPLVAFRIYDMDNDGFISNGELFQVLKMMVGNNLKETQLQQIVDKTVINADKDGDGKISFSEFCAVSSFEALIFSFSSSINNFTNIVLSKIMFFLFMFF